MRSLAGLMAAALLCGSASAGEIDLSFNGDALRATYIYDFASNNLSGDVGFLNNSDKGTVINASLFVRGFASDGDNPLGAGVGIRTGYVDGDRPNQKGIPVAVGAFFNYALPAMNRLSLRGDAWIAPDVLSMGDLDKYQDLSLRLQYALLREADIFVGARYVNTEFSNGSEALIDNGVNVGFNIRF